MRCVQRRACPRPLHLNLFPTSTPPLINYDQDDELRLTVKLRKKLIEVSMPLDAINSSAHSENQPFTRRHPRSLHIWWARMPLGAVRAVIFAQMVDDPSSREDLSPPEQDQERQRLFGIVERLVRWKNTSNEIVLEEARKEIRHSWSRTCADNASHPRAVELFDPGRLPEFYDPFAGGGALPMEAQRLGFEAHASDLNPVAVLIDKAMIEIPSKFSGMSPVNPEAQHGRGSTGAVWKGAAGLAEDVRYYGAWMRDEAEKRIGHLYPKIEITAEIAKERPDLKPYLGRKLIVNAYLWARTVKSPNPPFSDVDVPLVSTYMLSVKKGQESYIEPVVEGRGYRFTVKAGTPPDPDEAKSGTKLSRGANFQCIMSGIPITGDYLKAEGTAGRMGVRLLAIVAEGSHGRVYLAPTQEQESVANQAHPKWAPSQHLPNDPRAIWCTLYGLTTFAHLFTPRQLVAMVTFSDLVDEARERILRDATAAGLASGGVPLRDDGTGASAYAEAVSVYLATTTSRWSDLSNTICSWNTSNQNIRALFARQGIPMSWDFAELSPFAAIASWYSRIESWCSASTNLPAKIAGTAIQQDARRGPNRTDIVISTDPPYYDNVGYADLSDFFYVWLRRSLRTTFPDLFATLAVPKTDELIASPYRHHSKEQAELYFLKGMTEAVSRLAECTHPRIPCHHLLCVQAI